MAEFVKVAEVSDVLEGEMAQVELDGELVCLAHVNGTFYAISDTCTHQNAPLNEGTLEGAQLTCPLHSAVFDITTGKALQLPARRDLQVYEVKIEGQDVLLAVPE